MPNTVRTGYALAFSLPAPSVKVKTNASGTSIVLEVAAASGASMVVRYREAGALDFTESEPLDSPEPGDEITVSGLTENAAYEFFPLACSEPGGRGARSAPGNIIRAVPSSGSVLEKIKAQVAAELATWIPAGNIVFGPELNGKLDLGAKAALVTGKRAERERIAPGAALTRYAVSLSLYYSNRDRSARKSALERMAGEIAGHFDSNSSAFSGIAGYLDTSAGKAEYENPARDLSSAKVSIVCTVIQ